MQSLNILQPSAKELAELATRGPRYTSYPPAPLFQPGFGHKEAHADLTSNKAVSNTESPDKKRISLYTHIPFCSQLCWYCGCNVQITRDRTRGSDYVQTLLKELKIYSKILPGHMLSELSMGGGSPNFLDTPSMQALVEGIREYFPTDLNSLMGIELDPRDTQHDQVTALAQLGFRRLSVGVQDFEPSVQETINRIQSEEETASLISHARDSGFTSVGIDLVYGLPGQTTDTFRKTLDAIVTIAPQRIALFGYAHMPHLRKHQRLVERKPIPNLQQRAELFTTASTILIGAGYVRIGFDHFAIPTDPLAKAVQEKRLHRNFQGFTLPQNGPLLAVGNTGISDTGTAYWQNLSDLEEWKARIEQGELPVARGLHLSQDDLIRRHVIYRLMCDSRLDMRATESQFGIDFPSYFDWELQELSKPEFSQFATIDSDNRSLIVTALGFELIRNLCMVFDRYLRGTEPKGSTTI